MTKIKCISKLCDSLLNKYIHKYMFFEGHTAEWHCLNEGHADIKEVLDAAPTMAAWGLGMLSESGLTLHDFELTTTCDGPPRHVADRRSCSVRPSAILSVTILNNRRVLQSFATILYDDPS